MRKRKRSRSLQVRVLVLVGAGVFAAGALLSVLSRSALRALEREVSHDHQRLAASVARDLSRAVSTDMRLLAQSSAADSQPYLARAREFGRLATLAFTVRADGSLADCLPAHECQAFAAAIRPLAALTIASRRPFVSNLVRASDGRQRLFGLLPFSQPGGVAAAGFGMDPHDRRLEEMLVVSELGPALHARLRDAAGTIIAGAGSLPNMPVFTAAVPVRGTPWTLEIFDVGADPQTPIARFRRSSLWLAPTLAAVAMLLGWGIARSVRQPLLALTAAAERIAGGNFQPPLDVARASAGGHEVARLATALERMRAALVASFAEIERTNEELEWRVGERTRQLADANRRLEEREKLRQRLLRQVISAQEEERKRVARELHDDTGQTLAALGIELDLAVAESATGSPVRWRLLAVRRMLDRMHADLHRTIVNLRPSVLDDLGLAAAVQWLADHLLAPLGVKTRCEIDGLEERLPTEVETATFRVVQEALQNIARHAHAESVLIQADQSEGHLHVEIEDDGVGFDVDSLAVNGDSLRGVGLLGMRERVDALAGSLRIDSTPGRGTRVILSVPVPSAATAPS